MTSGSYANSETISSVTLDSVANYDSSTTQGVGSYADDLSIAAVGADGFVTGNYAITYDAGDLTIDPRPITLRK